MKFNIISGQIIVIGLCCFQLSSCGVKFASSPVNTAVPDAFTKRSIYESGVEAYTFQDLVGNILTLKDSQNPVRVGIITPDNFTSTASQITDAQSLNYYHSLIQKGAQVQGNYLAFAANFSDDQTAELTLVDVARAGITFDQTNFTQLTTKLTNWVQAHPKTDNSLKRVWVKAVVLSTRLYNSGTKINANASGQIGSVIGVKTGVYNMQSETIKSTILGFEAFDIDQFVGQVKSSSLTASGLRDNSIEKLNLFNNLLTQSMTVTSVMRGRIKDDIQ